MRIVFLGPPAAGKGTQSEALSEILRIPAISTGQILRSAVERGTRMGQEAKSCMAQARMVPDEVVLGIIGERMDDPDVRGGCILDGFPRTIPQANGLAELLEQRDLRLDAAIALDVPVELLPDRAIGRRMDKKTGRIYHLKYNPPPPGAELVHRADDQVETVAQRIAEYDALTAGLLPYYGHRGLLSRVDGTGTLQEVTERVRSVLGV